MNQKLAFAFSVSLVPHTKSLAYKCSSMSSLSSKSGSFLRATFHSSSNQYTSSPLSSSGQIIRCNLSDEGETTPLTDRVNGALKKDSVVVFLKTTCPYCMQVEDLFQDLNVPYASYALNRMKNGSEIQRTLLELTGQRTVPNIFIGGEHIGGCSDVMRLYDEGKLAPKLADVGIKIPG